MEEKKKNIIWRFLYWVKPSFEGEDGKSSYRRFIAFSLLIANACLLIFNQIEPTDRINAFYANLIVICLIIGIVTTQNILTFFDKDGKAGE